MKRFCPFFGRSLNAHPGVEPVLIATRGNSCALITTAHAPCYMQVDGAEPEWKNCDRNPVVNRTYESRIIGFPACGAGEGEP
jgi:hypothetical protein